MPAAVDVTGLKFNRLTAIRCVGSDKFGKRVWLWSCDCGNKTEANVSTVKRGKTMSCGCAQLDKVIVLSEESRQKIRDAKRKHGASGAAGLPEYHVWKAMRQRCRNPNDKEYPAYGGRGIQVCKEWDDFGSFLSHIGRRPSDYHSIDRIEVDGNYEPGNVRWATAREQRINQRRMK